MATDETPAAEPVAEKPRSQGEFMRVYVVVMTVMALLLGWLWWHNDSQADEYRRSNDAAKAVFGDGPPNQPLPDRPGTIRALAVGVLKYIATKKEAGKIDQTVLIPVKTITERATGAHLKANYIGREENQKNVGRRFEEISVSYTFDPTNLNDFAYFLFNIEASSSIFRILDFHWELKMPEKDNPVVQGSQFGHLTGKPTVRIGFRRPYIGSK